MTTRFARKEILMDDQTRNQDSNDMAARAPGAGGQEPTPPTTPYGQPTEPMGSASPTPYDQPGPPTQPMPEAPPYNQPPQPTEPMGSASTASYNQPAQPPQPAQPMPQAAPY